MPLALNEGVDDLFAHAADVLAIALAAMLVGFLAADVRGVSLDDLAGATKRALGLKSGAIPSRMRWAINHAVR